MVARSDGGRFAEICNSTRFSIRISGDDRWPFFVDSSGRGTVTPARFTRCGQQFRSSHMATIARKSFRGEMVVWGGNGAI